MYIDIARYSDLAMWLAKRSCIYDFLSSLGFWINILIVGGGLNGSGRRTTAPLFCLPGSPNCPHAITKPTPSNLYMRTFQPVFDIMWSMINMLIVVSSPQPKHRCVF